MVVCLNVPTPKKPENYFIVFLSIGKERRTEREGAIMWTEREGWIMWTERAGWIMWTS